MALQAQTDGLLTQFVDAWKELVGRYWAAASAFVDDREAREVVELQQRFGGAVVTDEE